MPTQVDATLAAKLLDSPLKYFLLDIDGVVASGHEVIPRVPETLKYLRFKGKTIRFLSNNSSYSRHQIIKVFEKRGIRGFTEKEVYNSGYAAALRLQQLLGKPVRDPDGGEQLLVHGNLFVIGEGGLHEELRRVLAPGFITYGLELHDAERVGGFDGARVCSAWGCAVLPPPLADVATSPNRRLSLADLNAVAVVVGLDWHFNTLKLAYAAMILRGPPRPEGGLGGEEEGEGAAPGALFIATNEDPQVPAGCREVFAPGDGCMVRAVAIASGREPDAVCGKPRIDMAAVLFAKEEIADARASCLMVGDRLTTDVAFGNAAGCQTMLVLSGVEGMRDIERAKRERRSELLPDYVADSLACFIP
ncbi:unnamed protein product [Phytomonas sp. EM1]|nr:unnamed protein product [Phytomonas sp. EM1]|eukprot:CCW65516.1 unnamed protein product [Phytomonas sp. isolate EM1]